MKTLTQISIFVLIALLAHVTSAQAPNWSIDPTQFQNSMSITAKVVINQQELSDDADLLAAFVGTEVRGVANINVAVGSTGGKVAFLQVYSNQNAGETVSFKVYDSSEGTITDAITNLTFSNDAIVGSTVDPLVITDNSPPTELALSNASISEAEVIGTVVGTLSTTDADAAETFTYALTAGIGDDDNGAFTINNDELQLNTTLDFETKNYFSVHVTVTDSRGAQLSKSFNITVTDIQEGPTSLNLSTSNVPENTEPDFPVATLSVTDEDNPDDYSFQLVNGDGSTDNTSFRIEGNQLVVRNPLNFEEDNDLSIRIRATDGADGAIESPFAISVVDTNDPPSAMASSGRFFEENLPIGTGVSEFTTTDEDANDQFTYTLTQGGNNDNAFFSIDDDSLRTAAAFNFEVKPTYTIELTTTDQEGAAYTRTFTFDLLDVNDPPTALELSRQFVPENAPAGTLVAELEALDEDANERHSYKLIEGDGDSGNENFSISGNQLVTKKPLDFETYPEFSVRLEVTDGTGFYEEAFVISVQDTNDDPTAIQLSNLSIAENQPVGTLVGRLALVDVDISQERFQFLNGFNDNAAFVLDGNELLAGEVFNFENKQNYQVDIQASDGNGGLIVRRFSIEVLDANDLPTQIRALPLQVEENAAPEDYSILILVEDEDAEDIHTISLPGGTTGIDNESFVVEGQRLIATRTFDFEAEQELRLLLNITDGAGASLMQNLTLEVLDGNDAPSEIFIDNQNIEEGLPQGSLVGILLTQDQDNGDSHTYTLQSNDFVIDGDALLTNRIFDDSEGAIEVIIQSQDSQGATVESNFTINILPVNQLPVITAQSFSIAEDAAIGSTVGQVNASDENPATLTFAVLSESPLPFALDPATGEITASEALDYENISEYQFEVEVTDEEGLSATALIDIQLTDVLEAQAMLPANNFLSPNGDGLNDVFEVQNVSLYPDFTLRVYNNSGVEVYFENGYSNSWQGQGKNGQLLPPGPYYYVLENTLGTKFTGTITLVR